jgi:hypothetical protein
MAATVPQENNPNSKQQTKDNKNSNGDYQRFSGSNRQSRR